MKCRRIIYILREKRAGGRTCGGIKYVVCGHVAYVTRSLNNAIHYHK